MKTPEIKKIILSFFEPNCRYQADEIEVAVFGNTTKKGRPRKSGANFAITRHLNSLVSNGDIGRWRVRGDNGYNTFRYGHPDKGLFDNFEGW